MLRIVGLVGIAWFGLFLCLWLTFNEGQPIEGLYSNADAQFIWGSIFLFSGCGTALYELKQLDKKESEDN